jgi:hypothetical protein
MNEDRSRWYGVRVGDIVMHCGTVCEVTALHIMDNNGVTVRSLDDPIIEGKGVAEWCKIITKTEDKQEHGR